MARWKNRYGSGIAVEFRSADGARAIWNELDSFTLCGEAPIDLADALREKMVLSGWRIERAISVGDEQYAAR